MGVFDSLLGASLLQEPSILHRAYCWVAVKELKLSYHNSETILFTTYISIIW